MELIVPRFPVEGFDVAVLPGTARFDIGGLGSDGSDPFPKCRCHELRAVIGTNVRRNATQDEEICENIDDVGGFAWMESLQFDLAKYTISPMLEY
jgi:hypothetical protein